MFGLGPSFNRNAAEFDYFVDAVSGNDANSGSAPSVMKKTVPSVLTASATGDSIALVSGQQHSTGTQDTSLKVARSFSKLGNGRATLDSRKELSGVTWTARAGTVNCWETTVIGRETTQNNGIASNSWTYHLWFPDNVHGTWKVGGADIAANVAAVDAAAGSYTVYKDGSTVQDPRSDTNGTTYVWVVHMPDGSNPNTKDIRISDRGLAWSFGVGKTHGIKLIGSARKDFSSSNYTSPFPVFSDHERVDCNEHGHVGPCHVVGTYKATGRGIPGTTSNTNYSRANGGGLNLYSLSDLSAHNIRLDVIDVTNFTNGVYGHGSGNVLYNQLLIRKIMGSNLGTVLKLDAVPTTLLEVIVSGVEIDEINVSEVGNGVSGFSGTLYSGLFNFSTNALDTSPTLINCTNTAPDIEFRNVQWNFPTARSVSWQNCIYNRATDNTHTTPIVRLHSCADISAWANKGHARRAGTYTSAVTLYLTGNTEIGSIMDQAAGTNYPSGLYVEAGCTFGMGDRTGPQIETALSGAGIPFSISGSTTIVNRAGTVLSSPGWK